MNTLHHRRTWLWLGAPLLAIVLANASALLGSGKDNPPADAKADAAMEKQVRALFAQHCYRCHSHQAGKSKGDLMLDSMASMRKGGKTAAAVVPGEPDKSLLIKAVMQVDDDLKMPRDGKLADAEIALLRDWIKVGAPWTETAGKAELRLPGQITDADRKYWAFQPVKTAPPPEVKDAAWASNPVDRFIRFIL